MHYTRVADEFSHPAELDLDLGDIASFEEGHWYYVGLCATLLIQNRPIASETLYGVPERVDTPCALSNELASAWVTAQVLNRAAALIEPTFIAPFPP